jgi:hypothetical protein
VDIHEYGVEVTSFDQADCGSPIAGQHDVMAAAGQQTGNDQLIGG